MSLIYSARWVVPITSPPIQDGAIAIDGSTIVAVGSRVQLLSDFPGARVKEFGDAVILPGLVNVHSHLELTVMRGFLEREENDFFAWLRKLTVARMAMTGDDLLASAVLGSIEAARAGITCLGDSSSFATQSIRALKEIGLRGIVYQESFGPDPRLAEENVAKLRDQLSEMRAMETDLVRAGVSPHAPYTVSARQLEMISRLAIEDGLPLMMHAAESDAEQAFITEGCGPFAEGLKSRGIEWQAPGVSSIRYLSDHGVLKTRPLLAHCINVDEADLELIKNADASIGHCPKSNAKLRHGRAPFGKFIQHGIDVGLGSDSVASNNTCDILEEARFATLMARGVLSEARPSGRARSADVRASELRDPVSSNPGLPYGRASDTVSAGDALFAATLGGARALGLDDQIGALKEGMQADIAVVNLSGAHQQPISDPIDTLIFASSGRDVILTTVAGQEIYRDQTITSANEREFRSLANGVRAKIGALD
jgi:cytosine/adenosine deaminase-related metal-dependent hydrolase